MKPMDPSPYLTALNRLRSGHNPMTPKEQALLAIQAAALADGETSTARYAARLLQWWLHEDKPHDRSDSDRLHARCLGSAEDIVFRLTEARDNGQQTEYWCDPVESV